MFIDELKDVQFLWASGFNNLMILGALHIVQIAARTGCTE